MTPLSMCTGLLTFVLLVDAVANAAPPTHSRTLSSEERRFAFNIPAQPLDKALIALGHQANQTVLIDAQLGNGIRSPGVRGTYTAAQALARLLAHTGLTFQSIDAATTVVVKSMSPDHRLNCTDRKSAPDPDEGVPVRVTGTDVDMVVVSGTHLKHFGAADSSAKRVYDQDALDRSGAATLAEFAALLPENFNSINPISSLFGNTVGTLQRGNNAFLGDGFNLYGMGPEATLTLVDGDRLVPGGASGTFLDIALLPKDAVTSVVTLTGDTAAVYGPDAIAGVVDIRLKTPSADGVETRIRYGTTSDGGGEHWTLSQLLGTRWQSGNALVAYEITQQSPVLSTSRSYIPVVVPPIDIVPEQRLASLVGKMEQAVTEHTDLNVHLVVGSRRVDDGNSGLLGFPVTRASALQEFGGTVHIDHTITPDWTVGLYGSYSKLAQTLVTTASGVEQESEYGDSSLAEFALNVNAEPLTLYGYPIRLAFGAGMHQETLTVPTSAYHTSYSPLSRKAADTYVEALLPMTSGSHPWFRRLELSIAAREDYYEGVGPTLNPKVGLVWAPDSELSFRATFASSFRPPTLDELAAIPVYYTVSLPDRGSPGNFTDTLVDQSQGAHRLKPETARTLTCGLDYHRDPQQGWAASMTWFRTVFDNRIATPVVGSPLSDIFMQRELTPFISRDIDPARVQQLFSNPAFLYDYAGAGPGGVEATFDNELTNLARTLEDGLEASLRYSGGEVRQFGAFVIANYLLRDVYRSTPGAPAVSLVNNVGQPTSLRARGGVTWSSNPWQTTLNVNFSNGYGNSLLSPAQKVGSWTTLDFQLAYQPRLPTAFIQDVRLTLDVRNLLNAAPPRVDVPPGLSLLPVGFDPANASPFGRMVSMEIGVSW